jgi:hypothetical protein
MPEGPEVRIKLVADDQSAEATEHLRRGLKEANEEHAKGEKHAEGLGHELLKAGLYVELIKKGAELISEGMHQAWEMAEHMADAAAEAADEANQQVRASSGLMMLMDQGAHAMGAIREYAKEVREELEKAGTAAGVSTAQMEEMFDHVIERGNRSTEQAKELTEQMALVGKVVPGGMGSLAEGFSMMELGIVRARNPLVQLIAATGELHGNARSVAQQMMHMAPAEQIEIATRAIEKQAERLRGLSTIPGRPTPEAGTFKEEVSRNASAQVFAPTMPELKSSFNNIREGLLEAMGQPMLEHLIPPLTELRDFLMGHADEIRAYAQQIGQDIGAFIDQVVAASKGIYEGLKRGWNETADRFQHVADEWRAAWARSGITAETIEHKFMVMAGNVVHMFARAAEYITTAAELINDVKHFQKLGTTAVADQREIVDKKAGEHGESAAEVDQAISAFRKLSQQAGITTVMVNGVAESINSYSQNMREQSERVAQADDALKQGISANNIEEIDRYLHTAIATGDKGAETFAFNLVAQSQTMTKAMLDGSIDVGLGFAEFRRLIDEQSPALAEALKKAAGIDPTKGVTGHGPVVNFNGGQTFHIKQDYRDQDPDRIMVAFRRDLGREVTSRRSSAYSSAFGL